MECRILDFNYLFQDAASVTASSQNTEFPVSNLKRAQRSRVWRGSGTFIIDATNNRIDFKEGAGGSELHATLTAGSYTPATLAAEIVSKIQAAGTKLYSCSLSTTTGKWSIATTNGTYLSILWQSGTNSPNSVGPSLGFSAAADSTGALTYTGANIAIHTEEWILIDTLTNEEIDSFAMLFDPMREILFSSNAQLWIQASATPDFGAPGIDQLLTIDTTFEAATHFWSSPQTYRYWRLRIKDPKNVNLFVEVSKIVLGKATQLSRVPRNGFTFAIEDQSNVERTKYGHEYADLYPQKKMLDIDYSGLTYNDYKALESIYRRNGKTIPILISMDSTGSIFDKDHFLIYGTFKEFKPKHLISSYFSHPATITEVF